MTVFAHIFGMCRPVKFSESSDEVRDLYLVFKITYFNDYVTFNESLKFRSSQSPVSLLPL